MTQKSVAHRPIGLETFPEMLWELIEPARAGRGYTLRVNLKREATALRHRFHLFRRALVRENYPHAAALTNLMCSLQEEKDGWLLVFTNIGGPVADAELDAALGLTGVQLEEPKKSVGEDEHDAKLREIFKLKDECAHEADATGVRCLKCNRPLL